jgi:hypothetical protein
MGDHINALAWVYTITMLDDKICSNISLATLFFHKALALQLGTRLFHLR